MSEDGEPDVYFYVFDRFDVGGGFKDRYAQLPHDTGRIKRVPHHVITTKQQLLDIEEKYLTAGFEGVMLRHPDGPYKQNRSTLREGYLLKLKRFVDDDFEVVGFQERFHNANPATKNALGHTERSMHQSGMVGRGDLGALVLRMEDGKTFTCGTGFSDDDRTEIWNNQDKYAGRTAKVKHFAYGTKDVVRFPVFLGWRDGDDK
jgi:DNA ligase-1